MRIIKDKDGERFLEIENKEDFEKFKQDLLRRAKVKNVVEKGKTSLLNLTTLKN